MPLFNWDKPPCREELYTSILETIGTEHERAASRLTDYFILNKKKEFNRTLAFSEYNSDLWACLETSVLKSWRTKKINQCF